MTSTVNQQEIADNRRRLVAKLRLRGATEREIAAALATEHVNPETNKPWSYVTIHNDLKALDAQWRAEMLGDTTEQKAAVLAEIREARRAAWGKKDLAIVLSALKAERELMGLDAPIKTDNTHHLVDKTDYDLLDELSRIAAAATERARAVVSDPAGT
jgi:ribosome maturation protein Sdo1